MLQTVVGTPLNGNIFANDGDPDGDAITLINPLTGEPATIPVTFATDEGVLVTVDPTTGDFAYMPPIGYEGPDSFAYEITDSFGNTDTATVFLNAVGDPNPATNDTPDAIDDSVITQMGTPVDGNTLTNDFDVDGDSISVTEIDGQPVTAGSPTLVTLPSGSTVQINDDGTYTYTPADDFVGTESLTYTIADGDPGLPGTEVDTASLVFSVFDEPPVAEDDINVTAINESVAGNLLFNDSDPNPNDELTVVDPDTGNAIPADTTVTLTTPAGGTVVLEADGTYQYTPPADFVGEDSFDYTVVDKTGNVDSASVSIEVRDVNDPADPTDTTDPNNAPPIATDDSFSVFLGEACLLYTSPSPRD